MATTHDRSSRNLGRLSEIAQVAVRHGFGYFLRRNRLGDLVPGDVDGDVATASDRGRRLRSMLDELGPTFVKFGQLLSTRPDVVPPDIVAELRGLQDDASPIPSSRFATWSRRNSTCDGPRVPRVRLRATRVRVDRAGASRRVARRPRRSR
jgi:predicted unusual protein kinase regulating ubiquinone biosynthesis (AarF/ABC1/UbiB family)